MEKTKEAKSVVREPKDRDASVVPRDTSLTPRDTSYVPRDVSSIPPSRTDQPINRRVVLAMATVVILGVIVGVVAWQQIASKSRTEKVPAPTSPQPTDVVTADEGQLQQITVETVGERTVLEDRNTTGKVGFNEDRLTPVSTPYAGRVLEVKANKGESVRAGQPLLVIESPDLVAAQNDLASARSDLSKARIARDAAKVVAERSQRLKDKEALATKDLEQAQTDLARAEDEYRRAQAALASVESRLGLFGKDAREIAALGGKVDRQVIIRAPIAGTIVDRKIGPGQFVKPDMSDPLFLISDLSTLWVQADVYESDLAGIRLGEPVEITVAAYPDRTFPAKISFISPTVDAATRTVRVRCLVPNGNGLLKPDMFAKVKISAAQKATLPAIPNSAAITQGNETVVFVEEARNRFRRKTIEVAHESGGYLVLKSGLKSGERVVTRGGLLLSELTKP